MSVLLPGLGMELLGLVADRAHKILHSVSVTKPNSSISKHDCKGYKTCQPLQLRSGFQGVQTEKGSDGGFPPSPFKQFLFQPFSHGRLQFILMGGGREGEHPNAKIVLPDWDCLIP